MRVQAKKVYFDNNGRLLRVRRLAGAFVEGRNPKGRTRRVPVGALRQAYEGADYDFRILD